MIAPVYHLPLVLIYDMNCPARLIQKDRTYRRTVAAALIGISPPPRLCGALNAVTRSKRKYHYPFAGVIALASANRYLTHSCIATFMYMRNVYMDKGSRRTCVAALPARKVPDKFIFSCRLNLIPYIYGRKSGKKQVK